jgi:hypothetical protein
VLGVGSKFWFRDLPDDFTDSGDLVIGYREAWWTFYPYLGLEKRRRLRDDVEFYYAARVGATAFTYQHVSLDDVTLYPKAGVTSQLEGGLRGQHMFLSAVFEQMAWGQSDIARGMLQPASHMFTIGLKTGISF